MRYGWTAWTCDAGSRPASNQGAPVAGESPGYAGDRVADEAGRAAYLAAFHAAQAFVLDRTGRTPKTHQGVRAQFGAWARREAGIAIALRRFLTDGYDLKTVADYGIGPDAIVSIEDATHAIETAAQFVECMDTLLAAP